MTTLKEPYFMENEDWYYFDEVGFKYKLTDKAPLKAIISYKEYYDTLDSMQLKVWLYEHCIL
ncbi:MAG: hypothetical protein GX962_16655 [Epulopiscium sp.]|nr:hypothetical protein [Candidatus Epulonipiscium sp.]